MDAGERRRASSVLLALATAVLVACGLALAVIAFASQDISTLRRLAIPLLLASLAAGFVALNGWRLDRAAAKGLSAAQREAAASRDELERVRKDAGHQQRRLRAAERGRERLGHALRAERDWAHELRGQLAHLHGERGTLGDVSDVRELILRVALELLEARKGMLVSRRDVDGDGRLDLVCSLGFDRDPADSELGQRFASEVLAKDEIVRENDLARRNRDAPSESGASRTEVDDEIHNIVAIPIYIQDRFSGVVVGANRDGGFDDHDDQVLLALGDQAGAAMHAGHLQGELRTAYVGTVRVLSEAIEAKDRLLGDHSGLVSDYVAATADQLGLDPQARERLAFASMLHDVGKIGISESILLKRGPLTPEERSVVELHTRIGARLVDQVPALRPLTPSILHHHERWDGQGYPSGLRGEEIPLEARVVCIADSFSAMVADRPYRRAMSVEDACGELERCAGTQFDPEIVRVFVAQVRRTEDRSSAPHSLATAMADPELRARADSDLAVLGERSVGLSDNLTQLYGHRHFHDLVASETERAAVQARPFAVVMAWLGLERVNREAGYEAGDVALRAAASTAAATATRCEGTACRFGGSRLALVVPGAGESHAEAIADELARDLEGVIDEVRVSTGVWRAGDLSEHVIARARGDATGAAQPAAS